MTDKTDPIAHAARLLREAAEELQQGHTLSGDRNNWIGEPEAKAAYDEHMGAAAALEAIAASAGSEPVAHLWQHGETGRTRVLMPDMIVDADASWRLVGPLFLGSPPSPPEGMVGGWVTLPGTLPEPGTPVLLDIGKKYPIRAMWAAKFTLLVGLEDDSGFGEHDERTDEWYCPEGWYEWNEHEETHWRVTETPRAWALLPPTTSAGSGKEE